MITPTPYEQLKAAIMSQTGVHELILELANWIGGQAVFDNLQRIQEELSRNNLEAANDYCCDVLDCFYSYAIPDLTYVLEIPPANPPTDNAPPPPARKGPSMPPAALNIGGLVAVAFDPAGRYLLTVSHSGRGVFDTHTWRRIARDEALAYPRDGIVEGIGPLAGQHLNAIEINYENGILTANSPTGEWTLTYDSGIATITPTPK